MLIFRYPTEGLASGTLRYNATLCVDVWVFGCVELRLCQWLMFDVRVQEKVKLLGHLYIQPSCVDMRWSVWPVVDFNGARSRVG